MIAAIVAPADVRSIAMMRACLVSGPAAGFDDAGAGRVRDAGLAAFRAVERVAAFGLDLGLVMGSSEVDATPAAAPPQPRPGQNTRQGRTLKRAVAAPSHHSNALTNPESQSILSKIVALIPRQLTSDCRRNTISPAVINNLTGGNDSLYALDQRLKDSIKDLEKADDDLSDRLHSLNSKQTGMIVTFSVLTTILLGLIGFVTREAIRSWIPSVVTKSVQGRSSQAASGPINQTPGQAPQVPREPSKLSPQ
jgi:hypothetical protein